MTGVKFDGVWEGWELNDGALISPSGRKYLPADIEPLTYNQSELARALGITRGAIADRMRRGTLPPFDDNKTWKHETVKHLFLKNMNEGKNRSMKTWAREGYDVVEKAFDHDLHEFDVVKGDEVIATITPGDLEDQTRIVADLDAGEDVNGWEDGMGNTIRIKD